MCPKPPNHTEIRIKSDATSVDFLPVYDSESDIWRASLAETIEYGTGDMEISQLELPSLPPTGPMKVAVTTSDDTVQLAIQDNKENISVSLDADTSADLIEHLRSSRRGYYWQ